MTITERAAYIKGLAEGLGICPLPFPTWSLRLMS